MKKLSHITDLGFVLLLLSNIQAQEAGNPSVKDPALRRELGNSAYCSDPCSSVFIRA